MGYYLKKSLSFFMEPYGLILILLAIGIFFLFKDKKRLSKIFLLLSLLFYFLFSLPQFSNFFVKNLETQYSKYDYDKNITYIHILGSGHYENPFQPISSQFSSIGIKRVLEGVIIHKKTPNSKIIFTGGSCTHKTMSSAQMSAKLAISLGVKKEDIIMGHFTRDTQEEAEFTKKIINDKKFVVVTSASHMPRAMMIFHSIGLNPIPAPTDFHNFDVKSLFSDLPSIHSIYISKIAIHEYIGMLWLKIKAYYNNFRINSM